MFSSLRAQSRSFNYDRRATAELSGVCACVRACVCVCVCVCGTVPRFFNRRSTKFTRLYILQLQRVRDTCTELKAGGTDISAFCCLYPQTLHFMYGLPSPLTLKNSAFFPHWKRSYLVGIWCCLTNLMLSHQSDVVSPIWCCITNLMYHQFDVVSPVWCCLTNLMLYHQSDVVSPIWCLTNLMLSHHLMLFHQFDVVSPIWCCLTNLILYHQSDVSPIWCITNLMYHQFDVSPIWCSLTNSAEGSGFLGCFTVLWGKFWRIV